MSDEDKDVTENNTPVKPFWIPPGVRLEDLPAELRDAIAGIVAPAYETLVVAGRPGLTQSTATTVVGLLWLEMLAYYELGQQALHQHVDEESFAQKEKSIARLLRLTGAKLKASSFLLRLSEVRRRWAKESEMPDGRPKSTSDYAASTSQKGG